MNLEIIKTFDQVALKGVAAEFTKENNSIKQLRLTDADGRFIVIRNESEYSSLKIMTLAPPETVDRWMLSGKFADLLDVREYFEQEWDANQRLGEYQSKLNNDDTGLKIEKVNVRVDDAGKIVEAA